ncbi:hypothetical protein EBS02_08660 [bacterium]|nr:hypothetical protein [bacterium]
MSTTMNATAYAISNMSSIGSTGITDTGNIIMQIINDTQSMQALYNFMKESGLFEYYEETNERHQVEYYYQIPVETWTAITGLEPDWFFRVTMEDGSLFYDRFFDADYKEYDMPDRYIYLSLNEKT